MSYSAGQQIEVGLSGDEHHVVTEDAAAYRNWLSVLSHSDSEPYSTH
ncbi:hypothetical protein SEA_WILKINS_91 [Mycobacterium phage Wilkins]|nr:hypothetical protein SEA_WILKINS_91 [Mycobacterium phage Wilkins]QAY05733.1 hypothetical protein SEA_FUSHIGI_85 [Mycobacterium phage Fushigi]QOI67141.1 hypothetical protein SEA_TOPGUN_90 [Mycobacterium phage Topgun]